MFGVMRLTNTAQGDFIVLACIRRHRADCVAGVGGRLHSRR